MTARVDKAGGGAATSPSNPHAWAAKWAEHGRRRLSLFGWLAKAKGLLTNLRQLRQLVDTIGDSAGCRRRSPSRRTPRRPLKPSSAPRS